MINSTLHALLGESIDYAGLYPPASLDEPTVVSMHARLLGGGAAWIGARLVWPTGRLGALGSLAKGHAPIAELPRTEGAWAVSAVTPPIAQWDDFMAALAAVETFNDRHASPGEPAMRVDCLEVKAASADEIERAIEVLPECFTYWEFPVDRDVRGLLIAVAEEGFGAKIRTGGTVAAAHPSISQVAAFIEACARGRVPFKATAGLHRALRHEVPAIGCTQHGFMNVIVGSCMMHAGVIDRGGLERLLADERHGAFTVDAQAISWDGHRITAAQADAARTQLMHSFGSCSYDEPLEDLLSMGLVSKEECA
ncbi:MAG: hypothetical protein FJ270_02680 [Planctomycetes bacterium]|nr:hypothetical protein [Planctomycetota bacterium]